MTLPMPAPYFASDQPSVHLYLMDCLDGLRDVVDDQSVSVVVTSPPYNIGIKYDGTYNDRKAEADYLTWLGKIAKELKRVLEPLGSVFLNVGGKPSDPTGPWRVARVFEDYFKLQNVIHWVKSIAISRADVGNYPNIQGDIAVGHYRPVTSQRFLHSGHEYLFHFSNNKGVELDLLSVGVPYQDKSNETRWKQGTQNRRSRGNVWYIPYETITNRETDRPHPAPFPVKLPEMCIRLHGLAKTRLVLDPLMGIGTTAVACEQMDVPCVGFEIEAKYLDFARQRLRAAKARKDVPQLTP